MLSIRVLRWKGGEDQAKSAILDVAAVFGQPVGAGLPSGDVAAEYFRLADTQGGARNFLGLLTRDVVVGGPSYNERVEGIRHVPNEDGSAGEALMVLPDKVGGYTTARMPEEIEVEGSTFLLTSGTGKLDAAGQSTVTPGVTEIGLVGGKYRIKQSGDGAVGVVTGKGLADNSGTTLGLRIRFY